MENKPKGSNHCVRGLFALLFELVGTFFLVYTIMAAYNSPFPVMLVLSILNILGYRISAAHFNPAITFASLFKRNEDRFERRAAFFYILFQCGGAFAGALFGLLEQGHYIYRLRVVDDDKIFQAILIEIIGTFVYVLLHMIGTDYSTRLSQDDLLNSFVMAAALGSAIIWGAGISGGCFNPASGLFINIIGLFNSGHGD